MDLPLRWPWSGLCECLGRFDGAATAGDSRKDGAHRLGGRVCARLSSVAVFLTSTAREPSGVRIYPPGVPRMPFQREQRTTVAPRGASPGERPCAPDLPPAPSPGQAARSLSRALVRSLRVGAGASARCNRRTSAVAPSLVLVSVTTTRDRRDEQPTPPPRAHPRSTRTSPTHAQPSGVDHSVHRRYAARRGGLREAKSSSSRILALRRSPMYGRTSRMSQVASHHLFTHHTWAVLYFSFFG